MTLSALAQERPVEIILVPPSSELYVVQPTLPDWVAPAIPCHLCGENKVEGVCGCRRPMTQELAEQLLLRVDELVEKAFAGRLSLLRPVRVRVVPAERLLRLAGRPAQGLYEEGVLYLSGELRRREGLAVLAHEYGHAWQYQHRQDIDRVEGLLFEGFAEWVSFRVLAEINDQQGLEAVMRDSTDYGRGARWYLALEKKSGLNKALESARYRLRR